MSDPQSGVQAQVQTADGLIVATGVFPAGSPDPATIEIVDLTEAQVAAIQGPPGIKYLEEDGAIRTEPFPPPPIQYERSTPVRAQVRTTDTVPLEVFRFPCDSKHLYQADLTISGVDATSFASKIMEGRFTWKRPGAAAVVVGLTVVSDVHDAAAASWLPNYAAQGTDVVFTVQGAAGRTIDWLLTGTVGAFAPTGLA